MCACVCVCVSVCVCVCGFFITNLCPLNVCSVEFKVKMKHVIFLQSYLNSLLKQIGLVLKLYLKKCMCVCAQIKIVFNFFSVCEFCGRNAFCFMVTSN